MDILYQKKHPDHPWLTPDAIRFLDSFLQPTDIGVEFGSGRSTLWFVERMAHLTSVEHEEKWYKIVSRQLGPLIESGKVDYRLAIDLDEYVNVANEFSNASIDCCLVDGKNRDKVALIMVPKIKPGGILIVDDVHLYIPRENPSSAPGSRCLANGYPNDWEKFHCAVKDWRLFWTTDGIHDTAIWFAPYPQ